MKTYTLLKDSPSQTLKKGDVVVEFHKFTYGCLRDEETFLGVECMAISKDGDYPFTIIPKFNLKEND